MATLTPVPDLVRALSTRPPWSEWLVDGIKPIEFRSWRTHWRGTLAIHASTTIDHRGFAYGAARGHHLDVPDVAREVGEFIGAVDLVDVHERGSDSCDQRCAAWGDLGRWHWVCTNARRITSIEARGKLGLFTPPADVLEQLGVAA